MTYERTGMPPSAFIRLENGVPVPTYSPKPTQAAITDLFFSALAAKYEVMTDIDGVTPLPGEEKFVGWTNQEVMTYRRVSAAARGDIDSAKMVLDRTLGKPLQQIEQKTENVTLSNALAKLGEKMRDKYPHAYAQLEDKRAGKIEVLDITPAEYKRSTLKDVW